MKSNPKKEKEARSASSFRWTSIIDIPAWAVTALTALSTISLTYIFVKGYDGSSFAPIFYTISAYTLAVICYKARKLKPFIDKVKNKEIVRNVKLRQKYSLLGSLIFNGAYITLKSVVAIVFHIPWLLALAAYYLIVFLMKTLILFARRKKMNTPLFLGVFLIIMAFPLTFIARDLVRESFAFSYPGMLIYVFALYSFIFLSTSIYGFIKHRKSDDINYKCYRTMSLSLSVVTLLTLQSAMFSSFREEDDAIFVPIMHGILSLVVVAVVVALGIYLIRLGFSSSNKAISK